MATPSTKTAFHYAQGPVEMYLIDANHAVGNFPDEWSFEPWTPEESEAAHRIQEEKYKRDLDEHKHAVEEAEAAGLPKPAGPRPPMKPVMVSDAERQSIDDTEKQRQEAAEYIRKKDEERRAADEEAQREAQARTLLAAPAAQPVAATGNPVGMGTGPTRADRERPDRLKAAEEIRGRGRGRPSKHHPHRPRQLPEVPVGTESDNKPGT